MNKRELAALWQSNYQILLDAAQAWAKGRGIENTRWGYVYRLVTAFHANVGSLRQDIPIDDISRIQITNFLNTIQVTGGTAAIITDIQNAYPNARVTDEDVKWTSALMNGWDSTYFYDQLPPAEKVYAQDSNGDEYWENIVTAALQGPKGDTGATGPQGPQGPPGGSGSGGATTLPGALIFENLSGNDSEKTTKMNKFFQERQRGVCLLPVRDIVTDVQIEMWDALTAIGTMGQPAREYGRKTTWTYTGKESSIFRLVDNRGRYNYPSDGSPRDGTVVGIEFRGNRDVIPRVSSHPGNTLWYWLFHNVGFNGVRSVWIGYGNGTSMMTGVSHAQAFTDVLLDVGGSENTWFGHGHCFIDSKVFGKQYFLRSKMDKSYIEKVMTTTRGGYTPLEIYGGHALHIDKVSFDAQDSDATNGPAIVVTNIDGLIVSHCKFKGMAKLSGPILDIRGGRQIVLALNQWIRKGADKQIGSIETPLVKVGAGVGDKQVVFSNNTVGDYRGNLVAARMAQIDNQSPWTNVKVG